MPTSEVYESRDEAGKMLLANLRDYGNLEPPGLWGRAYNAGTKSGYRFSCANYLRMAAATRDYPHKDNRWYSEEKIEESHLVLRENAHPVELEYWHGTDNGQGFEGNVRRFYNAEDIVGLSDEPEITEADRDSDREYAFALLETDGADMSEVPPTNEAMFQTMQEHAQDKGLNSFGAKLSAHLFMKSCRLDHDYQNHPLFTDDEIRRIESNPKILFYNMKQANSLLQDMEDHLWKQQRRTEQRDMEQPQKPRVPFDGLHITYIRSSIPLKNFQGEMYEHGTFLEGEKAYEFLVQLNAADKDAFDRIQHGETITDHTEIDFHYGRYDHGMMPLKLGTLELSNKTSVKEALACKLGRFRKELLSNGELRKAYLKLNRSTRPDLTEAKLIENCKLNENECSKAMNRMKWEEQGYLKAHPEIEAINEWKADVYRYVCDRDTCERLMEFPKAFVLEVSRLEEGNVFCADHLDCTQASTPEMRLLNPVPAGSYLLETSKSPEELLKEGYGNDLKAAFTPEDNKALADLDELTVRITNQGNVEYPYEKPVTEEYRGAMAVEHYLREKMEDARLCRQWSDTGVFRRGDCKEMVLSYRGEEFSHIRYELGRGQLIEQCPKGLPAHPKNHENRELQEAVYQQARYQGQRSFGLIELMQEPSISHPDMDILLKEAKSKSLSSKATNAERYEHYAAIALRDYANDTPEKFRKAMVKAMEADGLTKQRISNVAKVNPKFDMGLLVGKEAAEKSGAKKHTKKSVVVESGMEKRHERQRERERK